MSSKKIYSLLILLPLALLAAGCGKSVVQQVIEQKTGVEVNSQGNQVKMLDENGNTVTATMEQKLPDNFPAAAPYYKNARIIQGTSLVITDGTSYGLILATNDSVEDILKYYRQELKNNGWAISVDSSMNDLSTIGAQKNELTFNLIIMPNEDSSYSEKINISETVVTEK
ncbi:MAG: hypothetical protein WCX71_02205 [Candidatus Buchananbacteria bacterium]